MQRRWLKRSSSPFSSLSAAVETFQRAFFSSYVLLRSADAEGMRIEKVGGNLREKREGNSELFPSGVICISIGKPSNRSIIST